MPGTQANGSAANGSINGNVVIPEYIKPELFEKVLKDNVEDYKKIKNFKAQPAVAAGENYATSILRIEIEVELNDGKTKTLSYVLKVPQEIEVIKMMMSIYNMFEVENNMYHNIIPELEQLYKDAGVDVKFKAESYKIDVPNEFGAILVEDLKPRGFKNTNRVEGLDMDHIKAVLKKLAQWHAASAVRVATKGKFEGKLANDLFTESNREFLHQMNSTVANALSKSLKCYNGHEVYLESLQNMIPKWTDLLLASAKLDPNDFNVLNHGDCWSNNIMFQYDAFGKIRDLLFVDFQTPKYGRPAQDLFYLILSSTKLEIKLSQFDYFIKFYHDNLIENLNLLKYPKKLPTLRELHASLYKSGIVAFSTVAGVMAAVLVDPTEKANLDNFINDTADGHDFKLLMYTNDRYRKHIEVILPWLYNRGAFEC